MSELPEDADAAREASEYDKPAPPQSYSPSVRAAIKRYEEKLAALSALKGAEHGN